MARFLLRRLLFVVPQLLGITFVTFILVRLLPGDPARAILGGFATDESVAALRERLGLDRPWLVQFGLYLERLLHGDLGSSTFTGNSVSSDLADRFPATLELITISLVLSLAIMIPFGIVIARSKGIARNIARVYGLLAGALPDFWVALLLVFLLFAQLGVLPAPVGRLDLDVSPPRSITGMYTVDSLVTGNWAALRSAVAHLVMPVVTLVLVYGAAILKMTMTTMREALESEFVYHARAVGLHQRTISRYALRNALPPIVTIIGIVYGFLIGGAVLVEQVFSWGGLGQYAVQSVLNSDFAAVQGFVLLAALFSLVVFFFVEIAYFLIDPRVRRGGQA